MVLNTGPLDWESSTLTTRPYFMQACTDRVLIILGTQVIKKKWPVWPGFPDYLSIPYDYVEMYITGLTSVFYSCTLCFSLHAVHHFVQPPLLLSTRIFSDIVGLIFTLALNFCKFNCCSLFGIVDLLTFIGTFLF